jgi:hypothetical protein
MMSKMRGNGTFSFLCVLLSVNLLIISIIITRIGFIRIAFIKLFDLVENTAPF